MSDRYTITELGYDHIFPNPRYALKEGLLAFGGDLNPDRILTAYRKGIFPWYSRFDPILWWSPDPRFVLYPKDFKIRRSLRKKLRQKRYVVKLDRKFRDVMLNCAKPRRDEEDTWILPEVITAYEELYKRGFAHSIEVYNERDELVGGLYGISTGRAFFGESMFHLEPDTSKIALAYLNELAKVWSFHFIDCQIPTDHLRGLGAIEIGRDRFLDELEVTQAYAGVHGNWQEYETLLEEFEW